MGAADTLFTRNLCKLLFLNCLSGRLRIALRCSLRNGVRSHPVRKPSRTVVSVAVERGRRLVQSHSLEEAYEG